MSDRLAAALEELVAAIRADIRSELDDATPAPERLLSVDDAQALLGIGHSLIFDLIKTGQLRSLRVGGRRLIPASAITECIAARSAA